MLVIDAHTHCGLTLPFETVRPLWREAGIGGGVLFSPVEEVYNRFTRYFTDNDKYRESRKQVHSYLETLISDNLFAYWFIWNDFALPSENFSGIKWHRHASEPEYRYGSPECARFLECVCEKRLPIIIEDEFHRTLELVGKIGGRTIVIIPHFGGLNGGYGRLKKAGLFENRMVYVDTALADDYEISDFRSDYGADRILFGSDHPFGVPAYERHKVERLFSGKELERVLSGNLLGLLRKG